jgi:Txe/YoeB family toxin of Txe-Axe toxin-antitoxin module
MKEETERRADDEEAWERREERLNQKANELIRSLEVSLEMRSCNC